jgi:arginine/lysine/ornithine decarboxylase
MMDQLKTPLYDKLILHKNSQPISLHVPGHKNGALFPTAGEASLKELLKLDVTELTGLDDLHSPDGVIHDAEDLLSKLYKVKKSFFLINGSTVGNLAMIMSAIEEEEIVLVQRNCHKSIINGLQLANAHPVFLSPEVDEEWKVAGGVSYETVHSALKRFPNAKALIVTYPNYYGMVYELEEIIQLAHQHNIPVLVDEAHGAHFIAGEPFPVSAVALGADVVVQSAHKTLPAMTMGSFLHFNSNLISINLLEKYLHLLQSSSPSYPIMASLDIARSYLGTLNKKDKDYLHGQINHFKECLSLLPNIRVLSYKNGQGDPLKITIQSTANVSGFELQKKLEEQKIFAELADPYNLLFVVPLLKEGMEYHFDEIIRRARVAFAEAPNNRAVPNKEGVPFYKRGFSSLEISFKAMKNRSIKKASLHHAIGEIAAEMIIPYPPGIPILFPGEKITPKDVQQIRWLLETGTRFQGGNSLSEGFISIY